MSGAMELRRLATPVLKYWTCKRAPVARGRGARVPGRQRLRRGVRDAAPLTGRARSPRSGRARATSSASTCCARWPGTPHAVEAFAAEVGEGAVAEPRASTSSGGSCATSSPRTPRRSRPAPGASSSGWRSRYRARCWSATATRRSPTPSAPPAWTATPAAPSGPSRRHRLRPDHRAPLGRCLERARPKASARPGGGRPPRSAGRRRRACRSRRSRARRWASGSWPAA